MRRDVVAGASHAQAALNLVGRRRPDVACLEVNACEHLYIMVLRKQTGAARSVHSVMAWPRSVVGRQHIDILVDLRMHEMLASHGASTRLLKRAAKGFVPTSGTDRPEAWRPEVGGASPVKPMRLRSLAPRFRAPTLDDNDTASKSGRHKDMSSFNDIGKNVDVRIEPPCPQVKTLRNWKVHHFDRVSVCAGQGP